jgi:hypothetical protein
VVYEYLYRQIEDKYDIISSPIRIGKDEIYEDIMDHYFGDRSSAAVNTYTILSKL